MRRPRPWLRWPVLRQLTASRLRRLAPMDRGASRGTPVVRYYSDRFLDACRSDISGRCLEIGETAHIHRFGSAGVTHAEALDLAAHHPDVKVVTDLSRADGVDGEQYDCFIIPFVMTVIHDVEAALHHAIRLLRPGGILLVNFGCVDYYLHDGLDMGTGEPLHMYHWFTPLEVHNLLRNRGLGDDDYRLQIDGNLMTRLAFLLNMPAEELTARELDTADPGQPLLISARIRRPHDWEATPPQYVDPPYVPPGTPRRLDGETGHYADTYR